MLPLKIYHLIIKTDQKKKKNATPFVCVVMSFTSSVCVLNTSVTACWALGATGEAAAWSFCLTAILRSLQGDGQTKTQHFSAEVFPSGWGRSLSFNTELPWSGENNTWQTEGNFIMPVNAVTFLHCQQTLLQILPQATQSRANTIASTPQTGWGLVRQDDSNAQQQSAAQSLPPPLDSNPAETPWPTVSQCQPVIPTDRFRVYCIDIVGRGQLAWPLQRTLYYYAAKKKTSEHFHFCWPHDDS